MADLNNKNSGNNNLKTSLQQNSSNNITNSTPGSRPMTPSLTTPTISKPINNTTKNLPSANPMEKDNINRNSFSSNGNNKNISNGQNLNKSSTEKANKNNINDNKNIAHDKNLNNKNSSNNNSSIETSSNLNNNNKNNNNNNNKSNTTNNNSDNNNSNNQTNINSNSNKSSKINNDINNNAKNNINNKGNNNIVNDNGNKFNNSKPSMNNNNNIETSNNSNKNNNGGNNDNINQMQNVPSSSSMPLPSLQTQPSQNQKKSLQPQSANQSPQNNQNQNNQGIIRRMQSTQQQQQQQQQQIHPRSHRHSQSSQIKSQQHTPIQPQPSIQQHGNNNMTPITPQNPTTPMFGNQNIQPKSQQFNNLNFPPPNVPQIKFPNLKHRKFTTLQSLDNIKNEFTYIESVFNDYVDLKDQMNKFISDKTELQKKYINYFETCYKLNFEVQKQTDIINQYQSLVNKMLQKIPQSEHPLIQQCLDQIENIKNKQLPPMPQQQKMQPIMPAIKSNQNQSQTIRDTMSSNSSVNSMNSFQYEKPHGKSRGRPKSKPDKSKEGNKRIKYEENTPQHSMTQSPQNNMVPIIPQQNQNMVQGPNQFQSMSMNNNNNGNNNAQFNNNFHNNNNNMNIMQNNNNNNNMMFNNNNNMNNNLNNNMNNGMNNMNNINSNMNMNNGMNNMNNMNNMNGNMNMNNNNNNNNNNNQFVYQNQNQNMNYHQNQMMNNRMIDKLQLPKNVRLALSLPQNDVVCAVATSNPFRYIYTGGMGCVYIWDYFKIKENNGRIEPVAQIPCIEGYIRAFKITPDSHSLIVAGESRDIVICDITKPQPEIRARLVSPETAKATYALSTSTDSRYLFSCSSDGHIYVWDIHTSKHIKTLEGHTDSITCCSVTPDGKLITGSLDRTVRIWEVGPEKQISQINFDSQIFSLDLSPKEPWISVGLVNSMIDIRRLSEFEYNKKNEHSGHTNCVLSLKYAPSGNWFVTTGKDRQWIIWNSPYGNIHMMGNEQSSILCCDISSCGNYFITGSGSQIANIYEIDY